MKPSALEYMCQMRSIQIGDYMKHKLIDDELLSSLFSSMYFALEIMFNFSEINCRPKNSYTKNPRQKKNQQYHYGLDVVTNGIRL